MAVVTLATETWTGTTGAAWPSQWTTGGTGTAGSATIQANAGRLNAGTAVYGIEYADLTGMTASANIDLTVTITAMPAKSGVSINICSDENGQYGYGLDLYTYGGTTGGYDIGKVSAGNGTSMVGFTSIPIAAGSYYVRFQALSGVVKFKYWLTSASEPSTWTATYTDPSPLPAGKINLQSIYVSGSTSNSFVTFDNLTVTDGGLGTGGTVVTPPTGTASVVATETWTGANGAAWPAQWTTGTDYGTATSATIQGNTGQLNFGTLVYGRVFGYLSGMPSVTETDMTVTVTAFPAYGNVTFAFGGTVDGNEISTYGYTLTLYLFGGNTISAYQISRSNGDTNSATDMVPYTSATYASGSYTIRFQTSSGTVRFKIWLSSGTEPSTWTASAVDPSPLPAGRVRLGAVYTNGATASSLTNFDNLTVSGIPVATAPVIPQVYLGNTSLSSFKYGASDVSAVYIGLNKVYPYSTALPQAISTEMPSGNITSNGITWVPDFSNDFTTPAALGSFTSTYDMNVYDTGQTDTSGQGLNNAAKVLSVHDSVLDFYLHSENGQPYMATVLPDKYQARTYARVSYRFKTTATGPGYKYVGIMWPSSDQWNDGEIDWPEADLTQTSRPASAIPGSYNTTKPNTMVFAPGQNYYATSDTSDWHVATTEWTKNFLNFYWDGVLVYSLTDTTTFPHIPMRVTLQAETFIDEGTVPTATVGHVLIDWIVVYHEQNQES